MDHMARLIKWVLPVVRSTGAASLSPLRSTCPHTTRTITRPADIQCNCNERPNFGHLLWSACDCGAFP
eukprot:12889142-Prorocentrum_lima.AAC.1